MQQSSIRTLVLEFVDTNGASHIREMHIEILRVKPGTPEHTIRARLSEAVSQGFLSRIGNGFYDVYAEEEGMTSVVSYPNRCTLFGNGRYRGNCDGRLPKNLILRYNAHAVCDPMEGSGTVRDVVQGLNHYKQKGIHYWGGDLRKGFDLSSCSDYEEFRTLLMTCLHKCYEALLPGGGFAVLIGDVRRQGTYTAIVKDILNFPEGQIRSTIIKVQHNCVSDRRNYGKLVDPPIKHEYCVVFQKPGGD